MNVINNIRKTNLTKLISAGFTALILNGMCCIFLCLIFSDGFDSEFAILLVISLLFAIPCNVIVYNAYKLVVNPFDSDILKKYGSVEKINAILEEIDNTKEYADDVIVISKKYISDPNVIEKIIACKDVLQIYKIVHKTNFIIDYYQIQLVDKYGEEIGYRFYDLEKVNKILGILANKCVNACIGYTNDAQEYVNQNKIKLPKDVGYDYVCPNCSNDIEYGDKFCKECGYQMNWKN